MNLIPAFQDRFGKGAHDPTAARDTPPQARRYTHSLSGTCGNRRIFDADNTGGGRQLKNQLAKRASSLGCLPASKHRVGEPISVGFFGPRGEKRHEFLLTCGNVIVVEGLGGEGVPTKSPCWVRVQQ